MIRQHYLQQERLKYNHQRLLDRFNHLHSPHIAQFRSFGTSSLPGRNYEQHLSTLSGGHPPRRDSLVALSRASINSAGETYQWMNSNRPSDRLPRNVSSVIQYTRKPTVPLVHAERFEPVQVYDHPIFGPTPAYIRPIFSEGLDTEETHDDDKSDTDEDHEVSSINESAEKLKRTSLPPSRNEDAVTAVEDDDSSDHTPKGYISYKKWKSKYENIVPVNPLLFNIYTQRPNGSIDRYGESLYAPSNFNRVPVDPDDLFSPAASENDSVSSEIPRTGPSSLNRRYSRLQPRSVISPIASRLLEPIDTADLSDDEASPPDSPVPYLSRNKTNPLTPIRPFPPTTSTPSTSARPTANVTDIVFPKITPSSTTTIPSAPPMSSTNLPRSSSAASISSMLNTRDTSAIPSAPPIPSTLTTTNASRTLLTPPIPSTTTATNLPKSSSAASIASTLNTSAIPPAPPMPSTLTTTNASSTSLTPSTTPATNLPKSSSTASISSAVHTSAIPPAPPMPSTLSATNTTSIPPARPTVAVTSTSNIPPAPTAFPSLSAALSTNAYHTPSNLPLSSPTSAGTYQAPSNIPVPPSQSAPVVAGSTGPKAVTFGGLSSAPPVNDDVSSSSDSEDDEKQKRRRRKKRQAAGGDMESSSSDD